MTGGQAGESRIEQHRWLTVERAAQWAPSSPLTTAAAPAQQVFPAHPQPCIYQWIGTGDRSPFGLDLNPIGATFDLLSLIDRRTPLPSVTH